MSGIDPKDLIIAELRQNLFDAGKLLGEVMLAQDKFLPAALEAFKWSVIVTDYETSDAEVESIEISDTGRTEEEHDAYNAMIIAHDRAHKEAERVYRVIHGLPPMRED